jgi:hypothetical protein
MDKIKVFVYTYLRDTSLLSLLKFKAHQISSIDDLIIVETTTKYFNLFYTEQEWESLLQFEKQMCVCMFERECVQIHAFSKCVSQFLHTLMPMFSHCRQRPCSGTINIY